MQQYIARLDGGEGGKETIQADSIEQALKMAVAWAAKGDWSEPNPNHLDGVLVEVIDVTDPDDSEYTHYFPPV